MGRLTDPASLARLLRAGSIKGRRADPVSIIDLDVGARRFDRARPSALVAGTESVVRRAVDMDTGLVDSWGREARM